MTHMIATPSTCPRTVPLLGTGSALQPIRAKQCLFRAVAQALICLILVNCTTDSRVLSAAEGPDTTAAGAAAAAKPAAPLETWDICLMQGKPVGYVHTTIRNVGSGRNVVRTESENHLSFNRGGQVAKMEVRVMSLETPAGQLLSFECETRAGPSPIRVAGQVRGDRLHIETLGPGATTPQQTSIAWSPDFRGPFAGEQSLRRKPLQPGQRRTLKMLLPALAGVEVVDEEMTAGRFEPTTLGGRPPRPAAHRDGNAIGRRAEDRGHASGPTARATCSRM